MSDARGDCCGRVGAAPVDAQARRVLWIVLIANAAMFAIETIGGHAVGSLALHADALDFAADAATYGVTLWAVGRSPFVRARAALIKSAAMHVMGLVILGLAIAKLLAPIPPEPTPMGVIGALALAVNLGRRYNVTVLQAGRREFTLGLAVLAKRRIWQRFCDTCSRAQRCDTFALA